MGPVCNTTLTESIFHTDPIWNGMSFRHLGLILSTVFASIATVVSFFLIYKHATHYSKPREQKNIIRILLMVPMYAIVSNLSYAFYWHAIYFNVVRDCYEAFAIASFFALLCHYIAPDLRAQKDFFRGVQPKDWLWPVSWFKKCCGGDRGIWRRPRSGLTWFNIIWVGVFQYCFTRVAMTLTSLITQLFGRYCESSLNPAFAHIWTMVIEASAVTVAMYCLIEFYRNLRDDLASHRPFLKLLCIKLVIFLSFWQTLLISFLTSGNILKPSNTISHSDLKVGVPSMLLCIEMAIFAVLHVFAFTWKEYIIVETGFDLDASNPRTYKGGPLGIKAMIDVFNIWDIVKAAARGFRWLFVGHRKRANDRSYKPASEGGSMAMQPTSAADTSYTGAVGGAARPKYRPLITGEEGHELLSHAQQNPSSGPYAPNTTNPDTLTVVHQEPSMIDDRVPDSPPKQAAKIDHSADIGQQQARWNEPQSDGPQGRFSYEQDEERPYMAKPAQPYQQPTTAAMPSPGFLPPPAGQRPQQQPQGQPQGWNLWAGAETQGGSGNAAPPRQQRR